MLPEILICSRYDLDLELLLVNAHILFIFITTDKYNTELSGNHNLTIPRCIQNMD